MPEDLKVQYDEADRLELHGLCRELTLRRLDAHPKDWRYLLDLAEHELTFSRYREAKAAIDQAELTCPSKAMKWLLSRRGHLSEARGDYDGAREHYLAAHILDPDEATFLIFAASVAFKAGATEQAINLATRATQCSKGFVDEAYFNLGGYLMALRRFSEARDCYVKALELDPDYSIAKTRLEDVLRILALPSSQL